MTTKANHILQTQDLSIGYTARRSNLTIMKDLNLSLNTSQLVCFMGPNGVGKSTLLRTLCGTQKPLNGQILLEGKPLTQFSSNQLAAKISVVLTDSINVGNITVRDLVSFGRYPYTSWSIKFSKKDLLAIDEAIVEAGLEDIEEKKIAELSDGQRQKALIARALCQDTSLVILDEPTAHLDLNNRVEVINLLKKLAHSTNKTVLMATHELDLALQAADHLWLAGFDQPMTEGFPEDLVLNGKVDEIFKLKGFDLKTGVMAKVFSRKTISLNGDGHEYLWTKNALERNGYKLENNAELKVSILKEPKLHWRINGNKLVSSLEELVNKLNDLSK